MRNDEGGPANELWRWFLTGEGELSARYDRELRFEQSLWSLLPGNPRCLICKVPFGPPGRIVSRTLGRRRASFSPRICNSCEGIVRNQSGGAEVELTMLFADIRGSTALSEDMTPSEFHSLIDRFYQVGSDILVAANGMVNRLMGDQIVGLFVPRFAGPGHPRIAFEAAREILTATGHQSHSQPWVPVGIGIHSGEAFVGAVGSRDGVNEIAVLGKNANVAARLSSEAAAGEVIISETAAELAELGEAGLGRVVDLKGFDEHLIVRTIQLPSSDR